MKKNFTPRARWHTGHWALGTELETLSASIRTYKAQSFKPATSPAATFPLSTLLQAKFYDQYIVQHQFRNIEPELHALIVELRSSLAQLAQQSQQSSQHDLLSYAEKSKSTRMACALISENYDDNYVMQALMKKGYLPSDARSIIKAGRMEVYEEKIRTSRNITLVMGALWLIVIVMYLTTKDSGATESSDFTPIVGGRFVLYAAGLFIGFAARWGYYFMKAAQLEGK